MQIAQGEPLNKVLFRGAGTAADCASAVTAFARAAKAREALRPYIAEKRYQDKLNRDAEMNRARDYV